MKKFNKEMVKAINQKRNKNSQTKINYKNKINLERCGVII